VSAQYAAATTGLVQQRCLSNAACATRAADDGAVAKGAATAVSRRLCDRDQVDFNHRAARQRRHADCRASRFVLAEELAIYGI